jgi:hypothetical protein
MKGMDGFVDFFINSFPLSPFQPKFVNCHFYYTFVPVNPPTTILPSLRVVSVSIVYNVHRFQFRQNEEENS